MDVSAEFKRATAITGDPKNANAYDDDTKLKFYSLYKQATEGDLPASRPVPSVFQVVARAKHNAWNGLRGISKNDAQLKYIETLERADKTFKANRAPVTAVQDTKEDQVQDTTALANSTSVNTVRPPPPDPKLVSNNTMFLPALTGCGLLMGIGIGGFIFVTVSWTALFFISIALAGLGGIVGSLLVYWDENGLISIFPGFINKLLLDTTLLELIVEDKFLRELRELVVQILPAILAKDEAKMYETLSLMSPGLRQTLTSKGLVRMFGPITQKILLPRTLRDYISTQPASYRLPSTIKEYDDIRFKQLITQGKKSDPPQLDMSRELFRELLADLVSKKNIDFVLGSFNPQRLQLVAYLMSVATIIQLGISSDARKFLVSFIRATLLLASMAGAGISGGLFLLWLAAKRHQNMGQ